MALETTHNLPLLEHTSVTSVYNIIAEHFETTRQYKWKWVEDFVYSIQNDCSTIYDIGCGTGRNMTGYNTTLRHTFIGVDNCSKFIEICTNKGLRCVNASMTSLPFEDCSADAILSIASFHHLSTVKRRIDTLKEMVRVLKNDGKILLSVWSKEQPKKTRRVFETYGDTLVKWNKQGEVFERYYYIFRIDEIKELFDNCGLRISSHTWECGNEVFILEKI